MTDHVLTLNSYIEYLTQGHAFNKHVLGNDRETSPLKGVNAFTTDVDRYGTVLDPTLFPNLNIETPDDMAHYVQNRFLDNPNTIGYFSPVDGAVQLYNPNDNVVVSFSPRNGDRDLGTVFRYAETPENFMSQMGDAPTLPGSFSFSKIDNATPGGIRGAVQELVDDINARPHMYLRNPNNLESTIQNRVLTNESRPGRGWAQDEVLNPVNNIVGHSEAYATANNLDVDPATYVRMSDYVDQELNVKELRKTTIAAANDAGEDMTAKLGHDFKPDANLTEHFTDIRDKSLVRRAFDAAAPTLKTTGMVVLGALPIIGMLPNTVEAAELQDKLATAIDNGEISPEAAAAYNVITTGHIAQGADPTVFLGEAGVQQSFNDWADRYDVQGDLRDSLQPSSLALMMKDGGVYIAENIERLPSATVDVGFYAAETAVQAGEMSVNAIDNAYDYMSGNTEVTQGIYDALPSVDVQSASDRTLIGDHASFNDRDDILDLLQSKARAEYFEGQLKTEEDPDKQAYFGDRLQAEKDNFEVSVEAMDEDQLSDVQDTLATYNQYVDGSTAENVAIADEGATPTNPELLGSQPAATTNRIGM